MRTVSFRIDGRETYGIQLEEGIREASASFRRRFPDLRSALAGSALDSLAEHVDATTIGERAIDYLPTVPRPGKIICVGRNYRSHAEEMGGEVPEYPMLFVRFPNSIVGHRQPLVAPRVSGRYDFEGEVGVVIGRRVRHARRNEAMACVAGYVAFMDGSVRDWQRHTTQYLPGKNFDNSGAMGPWLIASDAVPDPAAIGIETRLNGVVMQRGSVADMMFDIPALIEYCSTFTTLEAGDVIATGTPPGVGAAQTPPVWLKAGDTLEIDAGPAGCLVNEIVDEPVE